MQDPTNQMDTSPTSSMLPDPDGGFGGAGVGTLELPELIHASPTHAPSSSHFSASQSAWGPPTQEAPLAESFAGFYYGADIDLDNLANRGYDNALGIQTDAAAFNSTTGQAPVFVYDVQNPQFQDNYGFVPGLQGHTNRGVDFSSGFEAQPRHFGNQALTTGFNHQAQSQGAHAFTPVFDFNPGSSDAPSGYHDPGSFGPVYANQTFPDATFANYEVAGSAFYADTASNIAFSHPACPGQAFTSPVFPEAGSASVFSDQNLSVNQYAAYQGMQIPTPNAYDELAPSASFVTAATSAQPMESALAITQQSFQCKQPDCHSTFSRDADRIRHEGTNHGINHGSHYCPIPGCAKAQGRGYSRADKVTEHLWKKHGDLGFVKRV